MIGENLAFRMEWWGKGAQGKGVQGKGVWGKGVWGKGIQGKGVWGKGEDNIQIRASMCTFYTLWYFNELYLPWLILSCIYCKLYMNPELSGFQNDKWIDVKNCSEWFDWNFNKTVQSMNMGSVIILLYLNPSSMNMGSVIILLYLNPSRELPRHPVIFFPVALKVLWHKTSK